MWWRVGGAAGAVDCGLGGCWLLRVPGCCVARRRQWWLLDGGSCVCAVAGKAVRSPVPPCLPTPVPAVELLPEEQWRGPSNKLPSGAGGGEGGGGEGGEEAEEAAPEGAHIAQVDPGEHYGEDAAAAGGSGKRPTGVRGSAACPAAVARCNCGAIPPLQLQRALKKPSPTAALLHCFLPRRQGGGHHQAQLAHARLLRLAAAAEAGGGRRAPHAERALLPRGAALSLHPHPDAAGGACGESIHWWIVGRCAKISSASSSLGAAGEAWRGQHWGALAAAAAGMRSVAVNTR